MIYVTNKKINAEEVFVRTHKLQVFLPNIASHGKMKIYVSTKFKHALSIQKLLFLSNLIDSCVHFSTLNVFSIYSPHVTLVLKAFCV